MESKKSTLRMIALGTAVPMVALLVGAQFGCAKLMFWRQKPQTMLSASDVPASQGTVKATEGKNGNTNVSVRVKHLAPPSKVAPDTTVYVVWLKAMNGELQNMGALTLNDNLEGSLDTVTPHSRFNISVTPEASGQVAQPSHEPVFTSEVERS
ncbi:MAG: hypothetical protein IPN59_06060 [Holophaga sp.]|nr:hypothetical protein [Holophaga sp.]